MSTQPDRPSRRARRSPAGLAPALLALALLVSLLPPASAAAAEPPPVAVPADRLPPPGDLPPPLPQVAAPAARLTVPPPLGAAAGAGEPIPRLPVPGEEPAPPDLRLRTADQRLVPPDPSAMTRGTPFWREWRNADGSYSAQVSTQPVFREDAQGGWDLVDLTGPSAGQTGRRTAERPGTARLAERATPAAAVVRLDSPAGEFSVSHPRATADAAGRATGNGTGRRYDDALSGGRDLVVERTANGFKQSVVAPSPSDGGHTYLTEVRVPAGVRASQTSAGAVELADGDGRALAVFGGGVAYDSAENFAQAPVTVRLVGQDGLDVTIEAGVDPAWFSDASRVFPVTIDPQWDWQQNGVNECASLAPSVARCDAYVDSAYPSPTQPSYWQINELRLGSAGALEPGTTNLNRTRGFLRFPTGDLSGNGYKVKYARVAIGTAHAATSATRYYDLYAAAQAPTQATNWSNQPDRAGSAVGRAPVTGIDWLIWDTNNSPGITALAQSWFNDAANNRGLRAEAYSERDVSSFRRFYSGNGGAGYAPILNVVYVKRPSAPLNPRAVGGDRRITAHWDPPLDWGGTGSRDFITALYDAAGQYVPDTVRSVCSTCYETTYTGLGDLASYRVALYARNEAGNSATVATPYATTNPPPPLRPSEPRNVTAADGDQQAAVTWDPPESDGGTPITDYNARAYEVTAAGNERLVASDGCDDCTQTSHTFTGLTNGTLYRFRVTADNLIGEGPAGTSNDVTPSGPPFTPGDVQAAPGDQAATVTWTAAGDNGAAIDGYRVDAYRADDDTKQADQTVPAGARTATLAGLDNGTAYYLTVTAHNKNGDGAPARSGSVVPSGPPFPPTGVTAAPGDTTAEVRWTAADDNGSSLTSNRIEVIRDSDGARLTELDENVAGDATIAIVDRLNNGTAYRFRVVARNANGEGPASPETGPVSPRGKPGVPGDVRASPRNGSAHVTWSPAADNGAAIDSYRVETRLDVDGSLVKTDTVSDSPAGVTGLANGTTYYFVVTARNAAGDGPPSVESNRATPDSSGPSLRLMQPIEPLKVRWATTGVSGRSEPGGGCPEVRGI